MIRPLRALLRAALLCAFASSAHAAVTDTYEVKQQASFEIYSGSSRLGTEKFRIYATPDTLITASTVRLDGAGPDSPLPFEKRTWARTSPPATPSRSGRRSIRSFCAWWVAPRASRASS